MCGVIGAFAFGDLGKTWPISALDAMTQSLSHRGPDDHGKHVEPGFFLGHTRLSIIDISPSGHQPMLTHDGRYIISFNGEIYNFKGIKRELESLGHRFISRSDTEVLLAAWAQWAEKALEKLDGIFAFAIFDRREKTLWLVRDHLGTKPLFYIIDGREVIFASELLAMFGAIRPCPEADEADIDTYFTFNYLPAPKTGLRGAKQLEPGHFLRVNPNGASLVKYWDVECLTRPDDTDDKILRDTFIHLLEKSVKAQMVSDAPLGLFLSGGLDSYSVALASVASGAKPMSFTLGFNEKNFDESNVAAEYAIHLGISNETCVFSWTEDDILATLSAMNELLADASCFPVFQLSRFTKKKATVILAGDGGDELLAGYDTYKASNITPIIRIIPPFFRAMLGRAARMLPSDNRRYGLRMVAERLLLSAGEGRGRDHASFRRIFTNPIKKRVYDPAFFSETQNADPIAAYAGLILSAPPAFSYLAARQLADIKFHLPSVLAKVDRMSMANGLEVRVPLLSRELVEFCMSLPDRNKRRGGKGKHVMRMALRDRIPEKALRLPKAGFLPPVDRWFRDPGPMAQIFADYLVTGRREVGWLNWQEVGKLWEDHKRGVVDAGFQLLGIMQFINWRLKCK
jgi:asparagine synthase (glutamine-hydrolysing)